MRQNQSQNSRKKIFKKSAFPKIYSKKVIIDDANKMSRGLGIGLYARKKIKKGETVFIIKGKIINLTIKNFQDSMTLPNAIGLDNSVWLDPTPENALVYLNHSCDPNVGIKGRVTVVALKDIEKGNPITIDYSITEGDKLWRLPSRCKCGSRKCRKTIRSVQHLPPKIYRSYLPYIPTFLQREYEINANL